MRILVRIAVLSFAGFLAFSVGGCAASPEKNTSRNDLVREKLRGWDSYKMVDDRSMWVTFWSGPDDCTGHRVNVIESDESVVIELYEGSLPDATICNLSLVEGGVNFTLKDPIGDRQIIDGKTRPST